MDTASIAGWGEWLLGRPEVHAAGLLLARLLPLILLVPLPGGPVVPPRLRFVIAAVLAMVLIAGVLDDLPAAESDGYLSAAIRELVRGLLIAVLVSALVESVAAAGSLCDLARDASMAAVLDPQGHHEQSVGGAFFSAWFVAWFFAGGGHIVLVLTLRDGLRLRPLGSALATADGQGVLDIAIATLAESLWMAVGVATPMLLLAVVVKFALGMLERVARPLQSGLVVFPVAGLVALLLLTRQLSSWYFPQVLSAIATVLDPGIGG